MTGNVKEWCSNGDGDGKRYILGGAWNEPKSMFNAPDVQPPFARSETYGFRCVQVLPGGETSPKTDDEIIRNRRNLTKRYRAQMRSSRSTGACSRTTRAF